MKFAVVMFASVAAMPLQAQAKPERKPIVGCVVDEQDTPLPAASVTFWGMRQSDVLQATDTVTVIADNRGRFVAPLLRAVPYCGFAVTAIQPDGLQGASRILGWFGQGAKPRLVCYAPRRPVALRCNGDAAWRSEGPLSHWLLLADGERALGPALSLAQLDDGLFRLPAVFVARALDYGKQSSLFLVRTGEGGLLWACMCVPSITAEVTLPPPRAIPFFAVDENGKPLAAVTIAVRQGYRGDGVIDGMETARAPVERVLGKTGADGRLVAHLPLAQDPFVDAVESALLFSARLEGRGEAVAGFLGSHLMHLDHRIARDGIQEVRFMLKPQTGRKITLVRNGKPVVRASVSVVVIAKLSAEGNGFSHDLRHYDSLTDADGVAGFAAMPEDMHGMRLLVEEPGNAVPIVFAPDVARFGDSIELSRSVDVQLRVREAFDGPCAGQCGYVRFGGASSFGPEAQYRFVTDSVGGCALRLWPAGRWDVAMGGAAGVHCEQLDVPDEGLLREFQLAPLGKCQGALFSANGRPVVGARVRSSSTRMTGPSASPLHTLFFAGLHPRLCADVISDSDGHFTLLCLPSEELVCQVTLGVDGRTTEWFQYGRGKEPLRVSLK
jgi:hypothetical protein